MKKYAYRLSGTLLLVFGVLCLWKFVELMNTSVDVGVEMDFYGIEIDETVPEGDIPIYAISFLVGRTFLDCRRVAIKKCK